MGTVQQATASSPSPTRSKYGNGVSENRCRQHQLLSLRQELARWPSAGRGAATPIRSANEISPERDSCPPSVGRTDAANGDCVNDLRVSVRRRLVTPNGPRFLEDGDYRSDPDNLAAVRLLFDRINF